MAKKTNEVSQKIVNSFIDRGDGVVDFPNGLVITDDSMMWSGTKYDINTLEIDEYPGQLTLDHTDKIENLVGKVEGVKKQGNKVTVDRIRYAVKASKEAKLAYELLVGGFSNAFSIETVGPWADSSDNTMYNHTLIGLSQVVMGNNKHAVANSITKFANNSENSEEKSDKCIARHEIHVEKEVEPQTEEGEDVAVEDIKTETEAVEVETPIVETEAVEEVKTEETEEVKTEEVETEEVVENSAETKAEEVEETEEAEVKEEVKDEPSDEEGDKEVVEESEEETEVVETKVEETPEVATPSEETNETENTAELVEQVNEAEPEVLTEEKEEQEAEEAVADDTDETESAEPAEEEAQKENTNNNKENNTMTEDKVLELINNALSAAQVNSVKEPEAKEAEEAVVENGYSLEKHINTAIRAARTHSVLDAVELKKINERNLEALKAAGKISNAMTIEDAGNFVLPPEMDKEIYGNRNDYSELLNATEWRTTDRLEFAWLTRNGDIEMQNTAMCEAHPVTDSNKNDNLKPITTYAAVQHIEQMEHIGAVTPVCTAATKYLAVDLIADAIAGYNNNYDKKRAELVIAKLQEAVNTSGNKVVFDASASNDKKLESFIDSMAKLSDASVNGTFIFTQKTLLAIMKYVTPRQSALGDRVFTDGKDGVKRIFGTPYIIVPSTIMPSLENTTANPVISYIPVDSAATTPSTIEITSPVFYGDLSLFTGYTSRNGLIFDISEQAAYEDASGVVRSAYQRDEIVLRGYFYRGGAYRFPAAMAAITNEPASA